MATVIAVDAMGSDRAPRPELEGAQLAVRAYGVEVVLVGREEQLRAEVGAHADPRIRIVNATEVIGMDEKAAASVKSKRDSSMRVGLRLVRDGLAQGFVSAGNTGAMLTAGILYVGRMRGILRPALIGSAAIAFLMSFENFNTTLMLVGADSPLTIMMYGRMREGATPVLNAVSLFLMVASALLALTLMRRSDKASS